MNATGLERILVTAAPPTGGDPSTTYCLTYQDAAGGEQREARLLSNVLPSQCLDILVDSRTQVTNVWAPNPITCEGSARPQRSRSPPRRSGRRRGIVHLLGPAADVMLPVFQLRTTWRSGSNAIASNALVEAERHQHARGVGAELNAGADLAQRVGLLVDGDVEAALG